MIRMWQSQGTPGDMPLEVQTMSEKKRKKPWKFRRMPGAFRLSVEDMDFLMRNTHCTEHEIRSWYKGFVKDCPDGNLQRAKVLEVCGQILPIEGAESFVDQIFRIFDKDGNGFIDFKEFMMAIDMTKAGTTEEKLKWAFKLYDMDNSGSIDLPEMTEAMSTFFAMEGIEMKESIVVKKAQRLFSALDSDGDGELSVDEFVAGCLKDPDLQQMFEGSNDTNSQSNPEMVKGSQKPKMMDINAPILKPKFRRQSTS